MNKILIILLFFLLSCGYQPIYINNDIFNFKYSEIILEGENEINKKIINTISIEENKNDENLDKLYLSSTYKIETTSKNTKGEAVSFRIAVVVDLEVKDINNKNIKNKNFAKQFTLNSRQNKFELAEYQDSIRDDLVNKIISEIIIYLNTK
tara:strand:+ start:1453 stop:1905 length:453 start_codon:yes stop_codon:yes gene_type:complete